VTIDIEILGKMLADVDRRYEQRFEAQEEAIKLRTEQTKVEVIAVERLQIERVQQLRRETDEVRDQAAKQFLQLGELKAAELLQVERVESLRREAEALRIAGEKAIAKSEATNEVRFHGVNAFRAQLADQATTFVSRTESAAEVNALAARIVALTERIAALDLGAKDSMTLVAFQRFVERQEADRKDAAKQRVAAAVGVLLALFSAMVSVALTLARS